MHLMAFLTLALSAADHWTTYLCLRAPIRGWDVAEANPVAEWLFGAFGLVPGLLIDSAVTLVAVGYLCATEQVPDLAKRCFFGVVIFWTGVAVVNNWRAIHVLGLSPLGAA